MDTATKPAVQAELSAPSPVAFTTAFLYWLKLGFISFGGPAGQIAIMHQELVEKRRWISEKRFLHALNYCMLLPGPEAQQLATYIGWLMHGTKGGIVAGRLFVLPSLFILIALTSIYLAFGGMALVAGVLFGMVRPLAGTFVIPATDAGPAGLSQALLGRLLPQFEAVGLLLLVSLVAVVVIVGGDRE